MLFRFTITPAPFMVYTISNKIKHNMYQHHWLIISIIHHLSTPIIPPHIKHCVSTLLTYHRQTILVQLVFVLMAQIVYGYGNGDYKATAITFSR